MSALAYAQETNRILAVALAEHVAEMGQYDAETGVLIGFDDEECAEAQEHEDDHGSDWEIEGFGEVAA